MNGDPQQAEQPPNKLALILGALVTLILVCLVARAGLQTAWRSQGDAVLSELSAEGLGVQGLFPKPPANNGAPRILQAAACLEPLPEASRDLPGTRPSILAAALADPTSESAYMLGTFSERAPLEAAIQAVLDRLDQAQPHLEAGIQRPIVYPADWERGLEAELDFLSQVRALIDALCLRAGWRSLRGDTAGAYADLEACLRLSRSLDAPQLIVRLVQIATNARCVEVLEDLLNRGPPPAGARLEAIRELLRQLEETEGVTQGLRGELHAIAVMSDEAPVLEGEDAPPWGGLLWGYWRKEHLQEMAALIRASRLPPAEFQAFVEEFEVRIQEEGNTLSKLLMPSIGRYLMKNRVDRARLRLALWGLALAQRAELPTRAENPPQDPLTLDTAPCRFKREGRGALLWSVGEDGRDAHGRAGLPGISGGPDDLTFRLLRK